MANFFIDRPIFAWVLAIILCLTGALAIFSLPVEQYPNLAPPNVRISATYPGASAQTLENTVTQIIEQNMTGLDNMMYMSSQSTNTGQATVTLTFEAGTDPNEAMQQVQNQLQAAIKRLPQAVQNQGVTVSKSGDTTLMMVAFVSTDNSMDKQDIADYIVSNLQDPLSRINGVGSMDVYGSQYAMRIWLDPNKLNSYQLTTQDVVKAIQSQNAQVAVGQLGGTPSVDKQALNATINAQSQLQTPEQFRQITLRVNQDGSLVTLGNVATVELGGENYNYLSRYNGMQAAGMNIKLASGANELQTDQLVKDKIAELSQYFPHGLEAKVAYETTPFVKASIKDVVKTLLEAILLVFLVMYLFLQNFRATLIPTIAVPVVLMGTFAILSACGFSINTLTMFAMVLAIGLLVDDAIVVVENVHRHIEEGKTPLAAAMIGAREVAGPVIAMTLTLAAVYAPIGLMGGLTGALFREFALTLAGAVVVSGVVALTLSPVMSSLLLPAKQSEGRVAHAAEWFFGGLTRRYARALDFSLHHRWLTGTLALLVMISLPLLYLMPQRELAPTEDQAIVLTAIKAPQQANLNYVERFAYKLDEVYNRMPETESRWIINGSDGTASGIGGINLTLWQARQRSASAVQADLQRAVNDVEGTSIFAFQLPALPGSTGGLPVQMVLRTPQDYPQLYRTLEEVKQNARNSGLFMVVDSDLDYNNPLAEVHIDRAKANSLGIRMSDIGESLAVLVGENYLNRFGMDGRAYDVIPQSLREQRLTPQALARQYVRAQDNTLVPLSTVVSVAVKVEPNKLTQFNQQNAATLQAIPAPGVSMGEAVAFLERQANALPAEFSHDWQGDSRQYTQEGSALAFAFLAALVIIYLVLAAQYESLKDPLIILITVPLSICGALLPLALGYATMNIYTQVGLVTLIGLISKHGILMVEFANELQMHQGLTRRAAILQAAQIRLRPVLMTTGAMVFGLIPLLFASGAGAASRFGLGLVIVSGMLVGTLFTLFVLPTVYTLLARDHAVASPRQRELAAAQKALTE
ncbi:efflux RND transporter permease subunit [Serratia marcescens]|uniref:efflux RND transporter permease subunit n=1 Tax=Serratia marcescens TaxID=615 RepID=UPI000F7D66BA|nr:efflux RND transporter permease subunit [Serratia marcescens]RTF55473.1 efflux RND transporter permease subunit [Serratia marcescens]RTF59810.1 efflux RND transporter permease subunit [Serratia marcescens]RTG17884.1 efflux RND transporter permease subunit [Serratia marcescens]RTG19015.1 efflux RND transporter permease subunit [Serratia marcescens]RTG64243.1 efflux RND transporter permease subunit [Serratia marcescens]